MGAMCFTNMIILVIFLLNINPLLTTPTPTAAPTFEIEEWFDFMSSTSTTYEPISTEIPMPPSSGDDDEDGFFDNELNIIYVAVGGSVFVICLGIFIVLFVVRKNKQNTLKENQGILNDTNNAIAATKEEQQPMSQNNPNGDNNNVSIPMPPQNNLNPNANANANPQISQMQYLQQMQKMSEYQPTFSNPYNVAAYQALSMHPPMNHNGRYLNSVNSIQPQQRMMQLMQQQQQQQYMQMANNAAIAMAYFLEQQKTLGGGGGAVQLQNSVMPNASVGFSNQSVQAVPVSSQSHVSGVNMGMMNQPMSNMNPMGIIPAVSTNNYSQTAKSPSSLYDNTHTTPYLYNNVNSSIQQPILGNNNINAAVSVGGEPEMIEMYAADKPIGPFGQMAADQQKIVSPGGPDPVPGPGSGPVSNIPGPPVASPNNGIPGPPAPISSPNNGIPLPPLDNDQRKNTIVGIGRPLPRELTVQQSNTVNDLLQKAHPPPNPVMVDHQQVAIVNKQGLNRLDTGASLDVAKQVSLPPSVPNDLAALNQVDEPYDQYNGGGDNDDDYEYYDDYED